jgi:hypothetical protein
MCTGERRAAAGEKISSARSRAGDDAQMPGNCGRKPFFCTSPVQPSQTIDLSQERIRGELLAKRFLSWI